MNVEFADVYDLERLEEKTYSFQFDYDDDRPRGYFVRFDDFSLFFPEKGFVNLLDNIEAETAKQRKLDRQKRMLREDADRYLDQATKRAIDNMMEN